MPSSYRELLIWQKAILLTKSIYGLCSNLPKHEQYGIISQMTRAAVSIPSNIAEGQQRNGTKEFTQFLRIALGSLGELETQLIIVQDVYSVQCRKILDDVMELRRMTYGVLRNLC